MRDVGGILPPFPDLNKVGNLVRTFRGFGQMSPLPLHLPECCLLCKLVFKLLPGI